MAVCNLFRPLTKPTGNFLTFSQYAEDLAQLVGEQPVYNVVPSKFIALDIPYEGFSETNTSIPQLFQNEFENMIAIAKLPENWAQLEDAGWPNKYEFFKASFWDVFLEHFDLDYSWYKYMADINITSSGVSADGMNYSEIFCYIPNDAKAMSIRDTWSGNYESIVFDAGETPEGWAGLDLPEGIVPYVAPSSYRTQNEGVTIEEIDDDDSSDDTAPFNINTIIILYKIQTYDAEGNFVDIATDIPLGIYFTGVISDADNKMTNTITKYVEEPGIYDNGTSYGLRICSRYINSPGDVGVISQSIVSDSEAYVSYASVMSAMARVLGQVNELTSALNAANNRLNEWIAFYRNQKVNVPYVKEIGDTPWWFVNGKQVLPVYEEGGSGGSGYRITVLDSYNQYGPAKPSGLSNVGTHVLNTGDTLVINAVAPGHAYLPAWNIVGFTNDQVNIEYIDQTHYKITLTVGDCDGYISVRWERVA